MATELLTDALLTRSAYIEAVSGGKRVSRAMLSNFLQSTAASHPVTGSLLEVDSPREMSGKSSFKLWLFTKSSRKSKESTCSDMI